MNDAEMTEAEFVQFIRGWKTAQANGPYDPNQLPEWRSGFAFYLQIKAEKNEEPTWH